MGEDNRDGWFSEIGFAVSIESLQQSRIAVIVFGGTEGMLIRDADAIAAIPSPQDREMVRTFLEALAKDLQHRPITRNEISDLNRRCQNSIRISQPIDIQLPADVSDLLSLGKSLLQDRK